MPSRLSRVKVMAVDEGALDANEDYLTEEAAKRFVMGCYTHVRVFEGGGTTLLRCEHVGEDAGGIPLVAIGEMVEN